jgi:hypothetical protein
MTQDKMPLDVLLREEQAKRAAAEERESRHAVVASALDEALVELLSAMIRASKSCSCSKGMRRHLVAIVERFGRIREEALDGRNCFDLPPSPEEQGQ